MSAKIRIGIYQQDIIWNNIFANQEKIRNQIECIPLKPDILVLPEMFSTGFICNPQIINSKEINSQKQWQQSISKKYNIAIIGSIIELENKNFYNRIYFTQPDGRCFYYDKRHLFGIGGEKDKYIQGKNRVVFDFAEIRLMPQICYDLRFPVWSRNDLNYHILIYTANWPASRRFVWDTLLKARSIENQCYTIGINRVGSDGNSVEYNGGSGVYGPRGETILLLDDKEQYQDFELSIDDLITFRESFPVLPDRDDFEIKNRK